jgi:GTP-binding protein Era
LKNEGFFQKIIHSEIPVILLLNKIDTSSQEVVEQKVNYWKEKVPNATVFVISALEKFNVDSLFEKIVALLPEAPPLLPKRPVNRLSQNVFL